MKNNLNLNYLATDLDESEIVSVAGGTNAVFFVVSQERLMLAILNMQIII